MPDRSIHAVIFDMDGVLTDSEPLINAAAVRMFAELGLAVRPEDFLPFVGAGEDRYIGGVAEQYGFALDLPAAKHRTYEIYLGLVPEQLQVFPGAVELAGLCRNQGLRIALASSADRVKIDANLRRIGLPPEQWDALVSAEHVRHKKPAPDIFLAAAGMLGLAPDQCVVVEDALNGVQAAKAAGMRCVAVAQTFAPEQLGAADLVRPTIAQVSIGDLTGEVPPVIASPTVPGMERRLAPEDRAEVWGFWPTLGFGVLVGLAIIVTQLAAGLIFGAILSLAGRPFSWETLESNGLFLAVATCMTAPVAIGLCGLFAWLRKGLPVWKYLGLNPVSGRVLARWCAALLGLAILSDLITWSLGRPIVPEVMHQFYDTAGFAPLLWLAILIAAPLGEEFVFRGFLFRGLERSAVGGVGAILLTAAVWAVIHLQYDWYGIGTVFVAGILLGYARWRTDSIYPSLIMHGLMNLIATLELVIERRFFT